jgi:hypothetical protein
MGDVTIVQQVLIRRSVQESFAYVSTLENWVDWSGPVIAVRRTAPGVLGVGVRVRTTTKWLGRWQESRYELVEWVPSRSFTLKSLSGGAPSLCAYHFEPTAGGQTRLSEEVVLNLRLKSDVLGLATSVVARALRRQLRHDLLTLKDMLEAHR